MIFGKDFQQALGTKSFGRSAHTYESVDSTNVVAKKLAESGAPEGTIVVAEYQTSGRGRLGRKWHGERGKGLLLSVILRPNNPELARVTTFLTASSVAETVEKMIGSRVECKWPNDLLVQGRKFCGILLESSWRKGAIDYLVVGVGMNVNEEQFPEELASTATSLRLHCGYEIDRAALLSAFLKQFENDYFRAATNPPREVIEAWQKRCTMLGKPISVDQSGRIIKGNALRIGVDGALVIEEGGRETRLVAGDVTVVA